MLRLGVQPGLQCWFVHVAQRFGVPFRHLPIAPKDAGSKAAQEGEIEALLAELDIDLIVLARYMQVGVGVVLLCRVCVVLLAAGAPVKCVVWWYGGCKSNVWIGARPVPNT